MMIRYWINTLIFVRDRKKQDYRRAIVLLQKENPRKQNLLFRSSYRALSTKNQKSKMIVFAIVKKVFCHSTKRIIFLGEQPHVTDIK